MNVQKISGRKFPRGVHQNSFELSIISFGEFRILSIPVDGFFEIHIFFLSSCLPFSKFCEYNKSLNFNITQLIMFRGIFFCDVLNGMFLDHSQF